MANSSLVLLRVNQAPKRRAANGGCGSQGSQWETHAQSWGLYDHRMFQTVFQEDKHFYWGPKAQSRS